MRTKKQKKLLLINVLTLLCIVGVIIGFSVIASPVKITFNTNDGNYQGETIAPIKGAASGKTSLPTPIRPGYTFDGWVDGKGKMVTKIARKKMDLTARWTKRDLMASLYLDGKVIREAKIPDDQTDGFGKPGSDFFLVPTVNDSWDFFYGWYYIDQDGNRVEILYYDESGNTDSMWKVYETKDGKRTTKYVIDNNAPFGLGDTEYNIALNAIVKQRFVTLRFITRYNGSDVTAAPNVTSKTLGTYHTMPPPNWQSHYGQFIGWRLDDESDILMDGENFYLDPSLYKLTTTVTGIFGRALTFTAVTLSGEQPEKERGTYTKTFKDGRVVLSKDQSAAATEKIVIDDLSRHTMDNKMIKFDFGSQYGEYLKSTVSSPGNKRYPEITQANLIVRTFIVREGVLNLPLANGYAIQGMVFEGWYSHFDGRVFPAGMAYHIPRGMRIITDEFAFTASWRSGNERITFDTNGGKEAWQANIANRKPGSIIKLPTPTRYGYEFKGWRDPDGTTHLANANFTLTVQKQRLIAQWQPRKISAMSLNLGEDIPTGWTPTVQSVSGQTTVLDFDFGTTITLRRYDASSSFTHLGWRFDNKFEIIPPLSPTHTFGAAWVKSIPLIVDEKFCTSHVGSTDPDQFFNKVGNINISGRAVVTVSV